MANELVKARDLTITYDDSEIILDKISFTIYDGDLIFITGKSGSGKSTLIKSIYGAIKPSEGFLQVGQTKLPTNSKREIDELRRNLGIVFQDYRLIEEWNIARNIALPLMIGGFSQNTIKEQVQKLLAHVKLTHRQHRFPKELSGGEQQRAAVARALSHNPMLILADEPTGNLDDYSTKLVLDLFLAVNELKKTVVIVTHRMPKDLLIPHRHFHIEDGELNELI